MTDTRNADLTFSQSDYLVFYAPTGTTKPTTVSALPSPWICLGWVSTDGGATKLDDTYKDIKASGTLDPIRTLLTASTKTVQATFEEALNPAVRSLYDNVPLASLTPDGTSHLAAYDLPSKPADLRYAFVFHTEDGSTAERLFAPNGKVTDRGDMKYPNDDIVTMQMTFTFYPSTDGLAPLSRIIDYTGQDLSAFGM